MAEEAKSPPPQEEEKTPEKAKPTAAASPPRSGGSLLKEEREAMDALLMMPIDEPEAWIRSAERVPQILPSRSPIRFQLGFIPGCAFLQWFHLVPLSGS